MTLINKPNYEFSRSLSQEQLYTEPTLDLVECLRPLISLKMPIVINPSLRYWKMPIVINPSLRYCKNNLKIVGLPWMVSQGQASCAGLFSSRICRKGIILRGSLALQSKIFFQWDFI